MCVRGSGLPFAAFALLAACGGPGPGADDDDTVVACEVHPDPTYDLGTGDSAFEPIEDGQDLFFTPGPQGGCHFWLAVRTDGFPERGTKLRYEVVYADTGTTTQSRSSFAIALEPSSDGSGRCEAYGATGFLIQPWKFEDALVEIRTEVWYEPTSTTKVSAMASKRVHARWPGSDPNLCGPRT